MGIAVGLLWEAELSRILFYSILWSSGNRSSSYCPSEGSSGCHHYLPSNHNTGLVVILKLSSRLADGMGLGGAQLQDSICGDGVKEFITPDLSSGLVSFRLQ